MQTGKNSEYCSSNNDVVEMGYDKIRVMVLIVCHNRSGHDTCHTTNGKGWNKAQCIQHGRINFNISTPHCCQPVEYLDSSRHSYSHCCHSKDGISHWPHSNSKHVVCPHHETKECNQHGSKYHGCIPE